MTNFEAAGNNDDWPPNVPGKATRAAVFGVYHPDKGKTCEILWTGEFPDLEPAMYWAAKKEVEAVRKGKWMMASRVLWQHELSPQEAVDGIQQKMGPQIDQALRQMRGGSAEDAMEFGPGPMKRVGPGDAQGHYVEIAPHNSDADPLASMWLPTDPRGGDSDDEDEAFAPSMSAGTRLTLDVMRETYSICRLPRDADVPSWALDGKAVEFSSISRTRDELSILRPARDVPAGVQRNDGWRGLKVKGPLDLDTSGVLAMVLLPLAAAEVPGFPVATFDTDYLFVRSTDLPRAIEALRMVGHTVHE